MDKNRKTSHILNVFQYDADGHVVLPASLTLSIAPASGDNNSKVPTTAWVRTYISGLVYATESYVGTQIANLVDSAPATLDTLNELAAALGDDPNFATTVATSIGTKQAQLNGTGFVKVTGTTVSYDNSTYLTTATAGTTYVPYTGATSNVDLGTRVLSANNLVANGGFNSGALLLKQSNNAASNTTGYTTITPVGTNSIIFGFNQEAGVFKTFTLNTFFLTNNVGRTYTLPDASGTLALTSDIPSVAGSYLPLTGGTLTGTLSVTNNGQILIGTTTAPTPVMGVKFPMSVTSDAATRIRIDSTQATPNSGVGLYANGVQKFSFAMFGATSDFTIYNDSLLSFALLVKGTNSNVIIGSTNTDDLNKLQVQGTASFTGTITGTSANFSQDSNIHGVTIGRGGGGSSQSFAYNTAIGSGALSANTTGIFNTAVGFNALANHTTGNSQVAIGLNAGRYITSGANNVTSSNSIYIGLDTRASANGNTNEIVIGSETRGNGSNTVTLGNTSVVTTILRGNVGIGTAPTNPSKKLEISDDNNSTSTTTGLKIINGSLTANARSGIVFQSYDNNGAAIWSNRTGTTTGELIFGTNNSASTAETNIAERMRIYSDGVVTTRIIQLNDPAYFASSYYGIRLAGVDNGVTGTNFQIQGRNTPTGGFSTLLTVTNTGVATFDNSVTATSGLFRSSGSTNLIVERTGSNGSFIGLKDGSGNFNYLGTINGTFYVENTSGTELLRIASSGVATFLNSISTGGNLTTNGGLFATGDVLTTGGRLLVSNGSQGANTETASLLLGNRGYFTTSDIGAARISAVATGVHWYSGTGLAFYTNPGPDVTSTSAIERMRIASGGVVQIINLAGTGTRKVFTDSSGNLSAPQTDTTYNISLSGISTGSWFNITAHNFSGFQGLVTIQIQNLNSDHGYFVSAAAWIFQQGHNGDPSYAGIRGVTTRPDGVSYEGYDVIESYHTAPISGRYNMRMRLRVRDAGLAAANPINLQIWVDHVVGITGTTSLTVRGL